MNMLWTRKFWSINIGFPKPTPLKIFSFIFSNANLYISILSDSLACKNLSYKIRKVLLIKLELYVYNALIIITNVNPYIKCFFFIKKTFLPDKKALYKRTNSKPKNKIKMLLLLTLVIIIIREKVIETISMNAFFLRDIKRKKYKTNDVISVFRKEVPNSLLTIVN